MSTGSQSSTGKVDRTAPNRKHSGPARGKDTVTKMIASRNEARRLAEDAVNNLVVQKNVTHFTRYKQQGWMNKFITFRKEIMDADLSVPPTPLDLEMFLVTIVSHIEPNAPDFNLNSSNVVTRKWMFYGYFTLRTALAFEYPTFHVSELDHRRIVTQLDNLEKEGKLTRDPKINRTWITSSIVRAMVRKMFEVALTAGCITWDIPLYKITHIVIMSALGTRAGDISVNQSCLKDHDDANGLPFLTYGDLDLRLVGGESVDCLKMKVTLRLVKGWKQDKNTNFSKRFDANANPNDNVLDPIKLILIMALRLGNVYGTSLDEVLRRASKHPSKRVEWVFPDRPVLCQLKGYSGLYPDKPAHSLQINNILAAAGKDAGFAEIFRAHDQRRGAARDVAHLPHSAVVGVANEYVRQILNHSHESFHNGETEKYVGETDTDTWTLRLKNDFRDTFGPQPAKIPYTRNTKKSKTSVEIDALCEKYGFDKSTESGRKMAVVRDNREADREWRARAAASLLPGPLSHPGITLPKAPTGVVAVKSPPASLKRSRPRRIEDKEHIEISSDETSDDCKQPANMTASRRSSKRRCIPDSDEEDVPDTDTTDPSSFLVNFTQALTADDSEELVETAEIHQLMDQFHMGVTDNTSAWAAELIVPTDKFVDRFSKINITNTQMGQVTQLKKSLKRLGGNSRDPATVLGTQCRNAIFGCEYTNLNSSYSTNEHQERCKFIDTETGAAIIADKLALTRTDIEYQCDRCDYTGFSKYLLKRHVKDEHEYRHRTCSDCPARESPEVFTKRGKYDAHRAKHHNAFVARQCPEDGCQSRHVFTSRNAFVLHLNKTHGIKQLSLPADQRVQNSG